MSDPKHDDPADLDEQQQPDADALPDGSGPGPDTASGGDDDQFQG